MDKVVQNDEGFIPWFGYVEIRENDRIAKRVVTQWVARRRDGLIP